jgi:hypothetical protein
MEALQIVLPGEVNIVLYCALFSVRRRPAGTLPTFELSSLIFMLCRMAIAVFSF